MVDFDLIDVVCNGTKHKHCPIKLSSVYCDGFKSKSKIGVFSHFHSDHISAITECIGEYDILITSPTFTVFYLSRTDDKCRPYSYT